MSVTIYVPTVLRRFTDNREAVELRATTVKDAISELVTRHPALQKHLYDTDGRLRSFVNIYLGENDVRHLAHKHDTPLSDGDVLTIIPSIAGGLDLPPASVGGRGGVHQFPGQDRAVWGTNGLPWKESLDQVDGLGLKDEARQKLLRDNARELFKI